MPQSPRIKTLLCPNNNDWSCLMRGTIATRAFKGLGNIFCKSSQMQFTISSTMSDSDLQSFVCNPDILAALVKAALHLCSFSVSELNLASRTTNAFAKVPSCFLTSDGST
uniref:TMV resistance protein N-like n=1 Tax=Rhizophora mucronata TaxID=61149 RepID=A0A2P2JPN6_RHIMU